MTNTIKVNDKMKTKQSADNMKKNEEQKNIKKTDDKHIDKRK